MTTVPPANRQTADCTGLGQPLTLRAVGPAHFILFQYPLLHLAPGPRWGSAPNLADPPPPAHVLLKPHTLHHTPQIISTASGTHGPQPVPIFGETDKLRTAPIVEREPHSRRSHW